MTQPTKSSAIASCLLKNILSINLTMHCYRRVPATARASSVA